MQSEKPMKDTELRSVDVRPGKKDIAKYLPEGKMEALREYVSGDPADVLEEVERVADTLGVSPGCLTAALFKMVESIGRKTHPAKMFQGSGNVFRFSPPLDTQQTYHSLCKIMTGYHSDTLDPKTDTLTIGGPQGGGER